MLVLDFVVPAVIGLIVGAFMSRYSEHPYKLNLFGSLFLGVLGAIWGVQMTIAIGALAPTAVGYGLSALLMAPIVIMFGTAAFYWLKQAFTDPSPN